MRFFHCCTPPLRKRIFAASCSLIHGTPCNRMDIPFLTSPFLASRGQARPLHSQFPSPRAGSFVTISPINNPRAIPMPNVKPTHKAIKQYYEALREYQAQAVTHEGAVETAFQRLLHDIA